MCDNVRDNAKMICENNKRKLKSLTERILLMDVNLIQDVFIYGINFIILGSTDKMYTIQVWVEDETVNCACNCADYIMRNRICKHIYWLGSNKFNEINIDNWDLYTYNKIITEYWIDEENINVNNGRNENCPICFENIDYKYDTTICCKNECKNSVHSTCWTRLYSISGKTKCVVCRTDTMPYIYNFTTM